MHRGLALSFVTSLFALSTVWVRPAVAASDTTPPQLVAFLFTPNAVDVSASPQSVIVDATITDDLAGFSSGYVQFNGPNNQFVRSFFSRTSGTTLNGTYRATVTVPRFVAAGGWTAFVQLQDSAGNFSNLTASNLQALGLPTGLTVTDSSADTLPPTLLSASFSPPAIDVSSSSVSVTLALQISDNLSGVNFNNVTTFAVTLAPPTASGSTARQYISNFDFHLVAGTSLNGTWQAVKTIPRYSPAGPWQIQSITLYDAITNRITLSTAQLQAAGINPLLTVNSTPSDTAQPTLTGLAFSPPLFNTSAGSQNMTVTMSASDNLSGVGFTPTTSSLAFIMVQFRSPSGNQSVYVNPFAVPVIVGGTPLAGTWQMTTNPWPQFSEEGTWQISFLGVKDAAGNQVNYTPAMLQAMGFPNSIVVTKPSLVSDGTLGSGGGTVTDNSFGSRASITFPPGLLSTNTSVSIDVFASPLAVPTPRGFTIPGTYFVNLAFVPALGSPIPAPGITLVLPLVAPMTPGAHLSLYHIDPVTGTLAPAVDAFHQFVVGTVNSDGLSATFSNVVTLSTVAAYLSNGSVLGDIDGSGSVTCVDVSLLRASFGRRTGQSGFNSAADLNNDGVVDVRDLILVNRQLPAGTTCQ